MNYIQLQGKRRNLGSHKETTNFIGQQTYILESKLICFRVLFLKLAHMLITADLHSNRKIWHTMGSDLGLLQSAIKPTVDLTTNALVQ